MSLASPDHWRSEKVVRQELELEAFKDRHIDNVISMQKANTEFVDKYLSGELTAEDEVPQFNPYPVAAVNPEAEQREVIEAVLRRTRTAMQLRWPTDPANGEGSEEGPQFQPPDREQESPYAVLGPAGSGKSTAVEIAIGEAVAEGADVQIVCPTGIQATTYKEKFPDLDVDTTHGAYLLYRPEQETLDLMEDKDLIVCEEVGQKPKWIFERLMRLWHHAQKRPALIFVGDFCQLRSVEWERSCDSWQWNEVETKTLTTMRRCKCPELKWKLELLRSAKPSVDQLKAIKKGQKSTTSRQEK